MTFDAFQIDKNHQQDLVMMIHPSTREYAFLRWEGQSTILTEDEAHQMYNLQRIAELRAIYDHISPLRPGGLRKEQKQIKYQAYRLLHRKKRLNKIDKMEAILAW